MTKTELIAQVTAFYKDVGAPVEVVGSDSALLPNVKRYRMPVFAIGLSEKAKQPLFADQSVHFSVYKEGTGDEAAYLPSELINTVDQDVTIGGNGYASIAKLYNSEALQNRVMIAIITYCQTVFLEDVGTANHANRMKLVNLANQNLQLVTMQFMCSVALNATVQAAGNAVLDATLLTIVTNAWNAYSTLIVA